MELPPDLIEVAARELNETAESKAAGLTALHAYYAEHPSEWPHRSDDPYLLMFLRHSKFDPDKCRARLAAMERWLRDCASELGDVSQLRGEMFRDLYGQGFLSYLGGGDRRTRDGAVISTLLPRLMEPLTDPAILLKWNIWVLYRAVHDPYLQVQGQVILESFAGFSLMHTIRFQQVPSNIMKRNFKFAQEVMPFRMRGIWLVHQPKWIGVLFAIAKPFMSAKLKSRVRLFGEDLPALHALIDPRVLPAEFGGTHPDSGAAWFEEQLRAEAEEGREGPGEAPS